MLFREHEPKYYVIFAEENLRTSPSKKGWLVKFNNYSIKIISVSRKVDSASAQELAKDMAELMENLAVFL